MITSRTIPRLGFAVAIVMAAALAGCGVRGPLEAPPEAKVEGTAPASDPGQGSAVKPKPHKEFLLDGLLR